MIEMPTARRERFLTPQTSGGHHALVCPYRLVGCDALCQREELVDHLSTCRYRQVSTYFPLHTLLPLSLFLPLSLQGSEKSARLFLKLIFLFLILIYFHRVFRDSPFTLSFSLLLSLSLSDKSSRRSSFSVRIRSRGVHIACGSATLHHIYHPATLPSLSARGRTRIETLHSRKTTRSSAHTPRLAARTRVCGLICKFT